jgi:hypothetical protein
MCDSDKKTLLKSFTKDEYIKRISDLIPNSTTNNKLIITNETVKDATGLIKEMSAGLYDAFINLAETDLVLEIKDALMDLYSLGSFLDVSFETILSDGT